MRYSPSDLLYRTQGGLISTRRLRSLAEASTAQGNGRLYASCRQEFILRGIPPDRAATLIGNASALATPDQKPAPNTVSTAPVAGLQGTRSWLSPGVFEEILGQLNNQGPWALSLSDPTQHYVPVRMGHINFLGLEQKDLWQLHLAPQLHEQSFSIHGAVRTKDIPLAAQRSAEFLSAPNDTGAARRALVEDLRPLLTSANPVPAPPIPRYIQPPGTIPIPIDSHGICSQFVIELCMWADQSREISVGLTPWRTMLIRTSDLAAQTDLRAIMLKRRVGEALNPWRRLMLCEDPDTAFAGELSRSLQDLCPVESGVAIGMEDATIPSPGVQILLRRERKTRWWHGSARERFSIYCKTPGDNPVSSWTCTASRVRQLETPAAVLDAIHAIISPSSRVAPSETHRTEHPAKITAESHACAVCGTEYDAAYGDPFAGIGPGTAFSALATNWHCPVCGSEKGHFQPIGIPTNLPAIVRAEVRYPAIPV